MVVKRPSLRVERSLAGPACRLVAGIDEVGRGALAGPVAAGVVVIDAHTQRALTGVADSKLLTHQRRVELVPRIRRWAVGSAVGMASAAEVDAVGLTHALRLAGLRALRRLADAGIVPDLVLMDGNYNWLRRPEPTLLDALMDDDEPDDRAGVPPRPHGSTAVAAADPTVLTRIKADLTCTSVAAASVIAKVERDLLMIEAAERYPDFGWEINKGYATPSHRAAIDAVGPSDLHRRTWRLGSLPGEMAVPADAEPDTDADAVDLRPGPSVGQPTRTGRPVADDADAPAAALFAAACGKMEP
ncbi:ribonuclease HII [Tersicoccus sp. Bi-70]|uniref:ribonuclease HII n=1 Tax=Tersicoccus sp. Bi-70 TaxID=1897634 RepID=UPI000978B994|nr:ribonuclease HII [Tersicoccus sp. Bi-70]OMH36764.1 ribonuclease HII [Tersicoccus sp. Bi-70]